MLATSKLPMPTSRALCCAMLSSTLFVAELRGVAHVAWRGDRREDFTVIRWYLYRQKAAFAAAYHVERYAHASCEHFGVMAGLGHQSASSAHQMARIVVTTRSKGRPVVLGMTLF